MNAPTVNGVARAASIVLILVLAAGAGLAVGNFLQQLSGDGSITAQASFSREAVDELNALRAERPAAADYPDYAIRHAAAAEAYPDWGIRHPTGRTDAETSAAASVTDTFRLTGPSDTGVQLRRQR